ncbi:sensor histidine kinase [Streptacidiphilus monticola]
MASAAAGGGHVRLPALTAAGVAQYSRGPAAVVGGVVVGLFCLCFLGAGVALERRARPAFLTLLAVMALLTVLALPSAHEFGFFLAAVVVPYTAVFVPRLATPAVAGGCLAAVLVPWAVPAWHTSAGWYQAAAILFTALTVRAFAETAAANRALLEARAEVARLASQAERARIARDLHDLLGHSLTVITVKSGLARRIAGTDPVRAVAEITEVEALSRRALADVRAAVSGYREVTLATELARGRELLRAAGILAELPAGTDHILPAAGAVRLGAARGPHQRRPPLPRHAVHRARRARPAGDPRRRRTARPSAGHGRRQRTGRAPRAGGRRRGRARRRSGHAPGLAPARPPRLPGESAA